MKLISLLILALMPHISSAEENDRFPTDLFGVELGSFHRLDENDTGTLPIRKLTGIQSFRTGAVVYFEPSEEYPAFPYSEYPEEDNEYFRTSFDMEVRFEIPESVEKSADIDLDALEFQVTLVEWQIFRDDIDDEVAYDDEVADYLWAKEMCESVELDLKVKPVIFDFFGERPWYQCIFANQDRELFVSSVIGRRLALSFGRENMRTMDEAIKKRMRQLRMDVIRPYNLPE